MVEVFNPAFTRDTLNDLCQIVSYVTTDGPSASLSWNKAPIRGLRPDFYYCQTVAGLSMWGALSDEKTGPTFTIAAGPRHRSHFRIQVPPRDSWPYFSVSDSRLHRLLRLAKLRWRYSTPPPHGLTHWLSSKLVSLITPRHGRRRKRRFSLL
jgi:hypothetical protein